jgi:hypothetical protein
MDMNDRPSPASRGDSLLRLRTVTAGVAIAGVAATVGFGFVAANGYRGTSGPGTDTSGTGTSGTGASGEVPGAAATPIPFQPQQVTPQDNGFGAPAPGIGLQPPTQSSGRPGHATTGGSGG